MKSLLSLHLHALADAGALCDTDVAMDAKRITLRHEHEGDKFLTITLPLFAKGLERALADEQWTAAIPGFTSRGGLPVFLRGFLRRVFDDHGRILEEPDANAIWAVRQVCYLTHKVERTVDKPVLQRALESFLNTDDELDSHFSRMRDVMPFDELEGVFAELYGRMCNSLEKTIAHFDLIPGHGPGAVSEKINHPDRWEFPYWPERLDEVFPAWRYTRNTPEWRSDITSVDNEIPVRVVAVPKTQSGPRLIGIEPSAMQYAQQGLKHEIYKLVESSPLRNLIGFTDQTRNRSLAEEASRTGLLATLDLSEASDRVHWYLVKRLLSKWPHLLDFVDASRSRWALVGSYEHHLAKFATMGSALTFPVETMIFSSIAIMGMRSAGVSTRPHTWGQTVSIYGDDIVVPVDAVADVNRLLDLFGFKVNVNKSFWTGKFRESCGADFYNGTDVSVVRLRHDEPSSRQDAAKIGQFTDFRNACYHAGLWNLVKYCDEQYRVIGVRPGLVRPGQYAPRSGAVVQETFLPVRLGGRYDRTLQRWVRSVPHVKPIAESYRLNGDGGLLAWFLSKERELAEITSDPWTVVHDGQERPHTFHIKMRGLEVYIDLEGR